MSPARDAAIVDEDDGVSTGAVLDLRRARRRNRLADLEWFEAAYRVYLVALIGGGTVLWLIGLVGDEPASPAGVADMFGHGPAVLGLVAALALLAGLRTGSQGGPLAIEAADVVHLLLAPVDRRRVLLRPAFQRVRTTAFAGAAAGAIAGQLASRRLPGSPAAWTFSGAAYGILVAFLATGAAFVAHGLHLRRWIATTIGLVVAVWQGLAVAHDLRGPADNAGSLALWGARTHVADLGAAAAAAAMVIAGMVLLGRTSLDALAQRSNLVAQLRFAVTMQDLRTVILLRRQLSQEHSRSRPWFRLPGRARRGPIWRRGWHGLVRLPASRLLRMLALSAGAGACLAVAYDGTTPAFLGAALILFVLGLEVLEPLSQEVDQPDRTDSLPVVRGHLLAAHLAASAVALLPFALVGAAVAALVDGSSGAWAVAAILALPMAVAGAAGGVVSIVRDVPDPFAAAEMQAIMPPEMGGLTTALRVLIPLVVSTAGTVGILVVREGVRDGSNPVVAAVRIAVADVLLVVLVGGWVRFRDDIHAKVRSFLAEGRAQTATRTSNQKTGA